MLTLIALSAVLIQEPPTPPAPPEIHTRVMVMGSDGPGTLDKDGDGQVSREEFAAPMNDHFARMDQNGDGRLSTEELSGGHGPDGDGDVVFFRGGPDGAPGVHRFEMRRPGGEGGREEREIVIHGPDGRGMPMMIHGGHGGPGEESRVETRRMGGPGGHDDMDKDGDGKVSEAEFVGPLRDAFARMDADHSGFIEEGEHGGGDGEVRVFTHHIETRDEH
ncbi:hypothetical protein GGQ87_001803 [Brevundimonas alba]|uniref:EF-hand domain-containing protein n=1 Tax=Brevundimonas alba TaxID=74314 RepID=A0A7X5YN24_9CAUL|nr:EF-hand domain-containing protein [Brevundimonas alba]NJC41545.1 hypothetical protein [Brevundimonas alba]